MPGQIEITDAMSNEIADDLLDLIERQLAIPRSKIGPETSLFHDCGVAGVDGFEFMNAFASQFSIDI